MTLRTTFRILILLFLVNSCQEEQVNQEQLKKEREQQRIEAEKEKVRIETFQHFDSIANEHLAQKKYELGINYLDSSFIYASVADKQELNHKRARALFELKNYDASIETYNGLITSNYKSVDTYFERALCFQKIKQIQLSVNDLKKAIELGNSDANELHEKINPLKRRVSYYVTRCCDGSTSNATGRGACSHHGGVCNWNEPVYEEYRKY